MNCGEAREYLFAFLDNELDAALSMEVQQHIEHCPLCARECEIEHVVGRRLAHRLQATAETPPFEEAKLASLLHGRKKTLERAAPRRRRSRWWALAGSAAAVLILLAPVIMERRESRLTPHARLPDALVDDFVHFVVEQKPLQIESPDALEVSAWLRDRTALAVRLPAVGPARGTLLGGRKCKIAGAPAAFAVYRIGNELASVVALRADDEDLAAMKRVERDGHAHWVDHCRGHTVLACRRGQLVYVVVSRLPEEAVSLLMPTEES
jgi:anti-sigma factor RsiW